ncbi:hypothetical protein [Xanthomonas hortorum]|uniref:hypothetical protein n=1 Tax=Xanthomonas hortorum TaxID=56454 RepID=UPI000A543D79|nr:hypothetical protein [Xanthomonas hortorum]MCC4626621.1 hypothetical protein [Xanthomonas campestris pv. nigromaculans]MCC8496662.1 hypothetical protein [Xanthomonas hortorum pv. gardneri]MCC8505494.1 hypothetical protein [Xanthomonas hortorum pv. gardneri]MCC8509909.1 hypothetical protein [Xanthomonas hortorum pv. gardneri]MCC8518511.1 hypothetical protein [Xanthomonas hortorum pv. gardneri]
MSANLISADQARANSSSFDVSFEQIIADIASVLDACSKAGERSITRQYLASAVSDKELQAALNSVREKGYAAEIVEDGNVEKKTIRISW